MRTSRYWSKPDVGARQPGERRVAEEAEVHVVHQRPEHEHAEDQRATGSAAGSASPRSRRRRRRRAGRERDARRRPRSGADPRARTRRRTRAARRRRRRGASVLSSAGAASCGVLTHDHELLVGEAAHDVALVAERLDHAHRRRDAVRASAKRRSSGRTPITTSSTPAASTAPRQLGRRAGCAPPGSCATSVAVDPVDATGRPCSSAGCR